jgi:hypothetical protein
MSTPDERPTTVLPQQTVEQPAVTTAPATRRNRVWQRKLPSRIGRARTSTLVIGSLFVLLFALNATLPRDEGASVPVVLPSGQTAYVNQSDLPSGAVPATTAPVATTAPAPARTSAPATSSGAPGTSSAPSPTPSESTQPSPSSTASSRTSRAPASSRAASTSAAPSTAAPTTASSAPTS